MKNLYKKYFERLTPVELVDGLYFKREDKFMPLEGSSANGSKLRQLIWLFKRAKEAGYTGVVAGAVSQSPQHPMVAAVARLHDMACTLIVGTRKIDEHPMLKLAKGYGAQFCYSPVGYAQTLQARAVRFAKDWPERFVVETNITMENKFNSVDDIRAFHAIGAKQVQNIPDDVDTLILPAGSCNSAVSVLYGIYLYRKKIKGIYLMGIGSYGSKDIEYAIRRLALISAEAAAMFSSINMPRAGKITLYYHNLNGIGFCKYTDLMPCNYGGIELHPRYEGKVMNYIIQKGMLDHFKKQKALFWNVGSEPKF